MQSELQSELQSHRVDTLADLSRGLFMMREAISMQSELQSHRVDTPADLSRGLFMTPLSRRLPVDTHLWGTDGGAVVITCMQGSASPWMLKRTRP